MTLLRLQTGVAGPYLRENLKSYEVLDQMGQELPTAVMTIGGETKRQFLAATSVDYIMENNTLSLSQWPSWNDVLLLDCELHLQLSGVTLQIEEFRHGHCMYHPLKNGIQQVESITGGLYGDIALYFCDLTLIFISDFGGLVNAVNLLCRWMHRALIAAYPTQAKIFLVFDKDLIKEETLWLDFVTTMLSTLRKSQPQAAYTFAEVIHICRQFFDLRVMGQEEVYNYLCSDITAKRADRRSLGLEFSAAQWKYLFRSAIVHHAAKPSLPFDLIKATRMAYSLPGNAGENITDFLQASIRRQDIDHAQVIASALVMDAFPQDMPIFTPDIVFDKLYAELVKDCEQKMGLLSLSQQVKERFKILAFNSKRNFMSNHINYVGSIINFSNIYTRIACSVCLVQGSAFTLDCRHRLCNTCAAQIGQEFEPWRFKLDNCPLCKRQNQSFFIMRPSTAGLRILEVSGTNCTMIWQFLKQLQQLTSLNSMPFWEHFDNAIGIELGSYFIIALLIEKWTFSECKSRIPYLKKLKYNKKRITFGKHLHWDLEKLRNANNFTILSQKKKDAKLNFFNRDEDRLLTPDISIKCNGSVNVGPYIEFISGKLLSCLFFIELETMPRFYTSPEVCSVVIRCRVPPSHGLLDLLSKLHRNHTCIYYQGSEPQERKALLCTKSLLESCRNLQPFSRRLKLSLSSLDAVISIQLDGLDGNRHNISNCPYPLSKLIFDQGLDTPFGSRQYNSSFSSDVTPTKSNSLVDMEIDALVETLQTTL